MVDSGAMSPHQCPGVKGGAYCTCSLSSHVKSAVGIGGNRQYDGVGLHQQVWGGSLIASSESIDRVVRCVSGESHSAAGSSYTLTPECAGGFLVMTTPGGSYGVANASRYSQADCSDLGDAFDRFVCNQGEQSVTRVCVSGAGSFGYGRRCPVTGLGSFPGICLPSSGDHASSVDEDQILSVGDNLSGRSVVAGSALVCGTIRSVGRSPSAPAVVAEVVATASEGVVSSASRHDESSRLQVLGKQLVKAGFLRLRRRACFDQLEILQQGCTNPSGTSLLSGVWAEVLFPAVPLFTK